MKPHSYTELFFLDEATALAAGHRPCFECRRQSALDFQTGWARAFGIRAVADEMDRVLDAERRLPRSQAKRTYQAPVRRLPDGSMVARAGYEGAMHVGSGLVDVLTPRSTTAVLSAGYRPSLHGSALRTGSGEALPRTTKV
jgi:hypothetical protein